MSEQQKQDQTDYQIILEAISKVTLKASVTLSEDDNAPAAGCHLTQPTHGA